MRYSIKLTGEAISDADGDDLYTMILAALKNIVNDDMEIEVEAIEDEDDNLCDRCGAPLDRRRVSPSIEYSSVWDIKTKRWGKEEAVDDVTIDVDYNEYNPTYLCSGCEASPDECECEKYGQEKDSQ